MQTLGREVVYSVSLAPWVRHACVTAVGPSAPHRLLRRALQRFLHGTSVLEVAMVNPVAEQIAQGTAPWVFDDAVRGFARQLVADELLHARGATALLDELHLEVYAPRVPVFVERVAGLCRSSPGLDPDRLRFLFVVVAETVLSASLHRLCLDPDLDPRVAEFVRQHAQDEVGHAAFLIARLVDAWAEMVPEERDAYGPCLAPLGLATLAPDVDAIGEDLVAVGLTPESADRVLRESLPGHVVLAEMRRSARQLIRSLELGGVLDHPGTHAAFAELGLVC